MGLIIYWCTVHSQKIVILAGLQYEEWLEYNIRIPMCETILLKLVKLEKDVFVLW